MVVLENSTTSVWKVWKPSHQLMVSITKPITKKHAVCFDLTSDELNVYNASCRVHSADVVVFDDQLSSRNKTTCLHLNLPSSKLVKTHTKKGGYENSGNILSMDWSCCFLRVRRFLFYSQKTFTVQ